MFGKEKARGKWGWEGNDNLSVWERVHKGVKKIKREIERKKKWETE